MLNLLFANDLDNEAKVFNLRNNYDIDVGCSILEEANRMGALAEEMEIMREEAREDGFEEGREEGRKAGREEGRKEIISEFADYFCAEIRGMMAERGISAEEAIAELRVPAGCRDAVLEKLGNPQ